MSFESLLINTCTIRRYTEGAVDTYGNPAKTWADHLVDEPCRLVSAKGREVESEAEVVVADYTLFVGDEDITEQDRVVIGSVTYEILLVERMQNDTSGHHKQLLLRTVR